MCVNSVHCVYKVYTVGTEFTMSVQHLHACGGTVQCVYSLYPVCPWCTL